MKSADRIEELLKYSNMSAKKFAETIGIATVQSLYDIQKGKIKNISRALAGKIAETFPEIEKNWLLTGEGAMLTQTSREPSIQSNASYIRTQGNDVYLETASGIKYFELSDNKYRMRVPLVPFNAYARYANEACSAIGQDREEWDEVEFIVDKIGHGNYMGFEIKGDSMDDDSKRSLTQGDIVLARELDKTHWRDGLRYEKYPFWIIVLEGTILCKQIIDQNIETGDITCHSLNPSPEYSDFTINLEQICRIFNIIQKTSTTF